MSTFTAEDLGPFFESYGWKYERREPSIFRTGFVGETGSAPTFTVEVRDTQPVDPVNGRRRFLRLRVTTP